MTFEEFIGDRISVLSPQEYHAVEAVWNYQQKRIDELKKANNDLARAAIRPDGYVLVPVEPTTAMEEAFLDIYERRGWFMRGYKNMIQAAQEAE